MDNIKTIYDLNDAFNHARRDSKPGGDRLRRIEELNKIHEHVCDRRQPDCVQCYFERTAQ